MPLAEPHGPFWTADEKEPHPLQLCGINSKYWREFLKTFQEGTTDQQARAALERLKQKVEGTVDIPRPTAQSALAILDELENLLDLPN